MDPLEAAARPGVWPIGRMTDFVRYMLANHDLAPRTLAQYVSTVRAHVERVHRYTYASPPHLSGFIERLGGMPHAPKDIKRAAPRDLVEKVWADRTISIGTRAAVVASWNALHRPGELTVSPKWTTYPDAFLLGRDVLPTRINDLDGYAFRLKRSKTDRYNDGQMAHVVRREDDPICAVHAINAYRAAQPLAHRPDFPFFVRDVHPLTRVVSYVSAADMTRALRKHASALGIDPKTVSAKSLRSGGAFALADNDTPIAGIQQMGRWSQRGSNEIALMYSQMSAKRITDLSNGLRPPTRPSGLILVADDTPTSAVPKPTRKRTQTGRSTRQRTLMGRQHG